MVPASAGSTGCAGRLSRQVHSGIRQFLPTAMFCLAIFLFLPASAHAAGPRYRTDIVDWFRLVNVDGNFSARYYFEDRTSDSTASGSAMNRTDWEQELYIGTESYVYHPGFLKLRIGGGPLLVQQDLSNGVDSNSNEEALFNFRTQFDFLSIKPYPFTIYYEQSHPGVTTSLAGRFLTRATEYGVNGRLAETLLPMRLQYELRHHDSKGAGVGTTVDNESDIATLRAAKSYGSGDNVNLYVQSFEEESASGSPGLPINPSAIKTFNSGISTSNAFGERQQFKLRQQLDSIDQETRVASSLSEFSSLNYFGTFDWLHREGLNSIYRYQHRDNDRDGTRSTGRVGSAAASLHKSNFAYSAGVSLSSNDTAGFGQERRQATAGMSYSKPLSFGSITLAMRFESVALNSTVPVPLLNRFIAAGSVIVRNEQKTQVFVEGLDYRLVITGAVTAIQRLIDGNIADAETVLVEYDYETGGTVQYDTLGQNYSASIGFLKHYSAHLSYSDTDNDVNGGVSTIPLNSRRAISARLRSDYPISKSWVAGGEIAHVDQQEEISPFDSDYLTAYINYQFASGTRARFAASYLSVDYDNSIEDVKSQRFSFALNSRLPWNIRLTYNISADRDLGGSIPRKSLFQNMIAQWNFRLVRISLRARLTDETLGTTSRQHFTVRAQLERIF